jgi:folate-binding protein YgfZ
MNTFALPDTSLWQGATRLAHLSPLVAEGADAATFLHGQLSQDVLNLPQGVARPAAYCSAKGRMLADALVFKPRDDTFVLLMDKGVLPATLKRLQMFVMRAKAKLSDAGATLALVGLVGHDLIAHLAPEATQPHQVCALADGAHVIRLADVQGLARAIWVGNPEQAEILLADQPALPGDAWAWLEVMSGVVRIVPATADQFVPQMVNFEIIGGVNFKKGCYPGQEVVARSQYRGTLKRRLHLGHAAVLAQAGQEVFAADDPGQPAGTVANMATVPGSQDSSSVLLELKLAHAASALHLGSSDGPLITLSALPYEIPPQDAI